MTQFRIKRVLIILFVSLCVIKRFRDSRFLRRGNLVNSILFTVSDFRFIVMKRIANVRLSLCAQYPIVSYPPKYMYNILNWALKIEGSGGIIVEGMCAQFTGLRVGSELSWVLGVLKVHMGIQIWRYDGFRVVYVPLFQTDDYYLIRKCIIRKRTPSHPEGSVSR